MMVETAPRLDLLLQDSPRRMRRLVVARLADAARGDPTALRVESMLRELLSEIDRHDHLLRARPFTPAHREQVLRLKLRLEKLSRAISNEATDSKRGGDNSAKARKPEYERKRMARMPAAVIVALEVQRGRTLREIADDNALTPLIGRLSKSSIGARRTEGEAFLAGLEPDVRHARLDDWKAIASLRTKGGFQTAALEFKQRLISLVQSNP